MNPEQVSESSVENKAEKQREAIRSLTENATQLGGDVKQYGAPEGVQFGSEYSEHEYATNNGWANFKHDGQMYAVYATPEVSKKLEDAGFTKGDHGVVDNNPDRFHAGQDSSAFKAMVGQVGQARQMEKNKDEMYLTDEAYQAKYGTAKGQ